MVHVVEYDAPSCAMTAVMHGHVALDDYPLVLGIVGDEKVEKTAIGPTRRQYRMVEKPAFL